MPDYEPVLAGRIQLIQGSNIVHGHIVEPLQAQLFSAVPPPPYDRVASAGGCSIFRPQEAGLCQPPCDGFCAEDGRCLALSDTQSAGEIRLHNLLGPLRFVPGSYGYSVDTTLGDDIFAPGACVFAVAPGASFDAFALSVRAPVAVTTSASRVDLVDGQDFMLRWTPAGAALVRLLIEVGQHATPGTLLLCESPDDGELLIPRQLIAQFPLYTPGPNSISGSAVFGSIARAHVTTSAGLLELMLAQQVALEFTHSAE